MFSAPVTTESALRIAERFLSRIDCDNGHRISSQVELLDNGSIYAHLFILNPEGYIITSADNTLPPVMAYSLNSSYETTDEDNVLAQLLKADISSRINNINLVSTDLIRDREQVWSLDDSRAVDPPLVSWPPEGTTTTGGWIETRWTQSGIYNALCPMDNVSDTRSYAGCPAVALAQILNYHQTLNGTRFNDSDDYHHNYGGNNYWIDNDSATFGFPDFVTLNSYLDNASDQLKYGNPLNNTDKGALVFAAGVAAQQVYNSAGSGTFSVAQAFQSYQRFNFQNIELLTDTATDVNSRMAQNIMEGKPVHYAVVTPAWDSGHNFVVDGYNSDGFFHTNFGWGGTYDGWYLLPDELPYNLTVLEGAIVDIEPYHYGGVFPEDIEVLLPEDILEPIEIIVYNDGSLDGLTVEDIVIECDYPEINWDITHETLPISLVFGATTTITILPEPGSPVRTPIHACLRVILPESSLRVQISLNPSVGVSDENSGTFPSGLILKQNYPNPFKAETTISYEMKNEDRLSLSIYNIRGELVRSISNIRSYIGDNSLEWDGKDNRNQNCVSGLYFYRLKGVNTQASGKMLLIK
jgi:hypothetical protein